MRRACTWRAYRRDLAGRQTWARDGRCAPLPVNRNRRFAASGARQQTTLPSRHCTVIVTILLATAAIVPAPRAVRLAARTPAAGANRACSARSWIWPMRWNANCSNAARACARFRPWRRPRRPPSSSPRAARWPPNRRSRTRCAISSRTGCGCKEHAQTATIAELARRARRSPRRARQLAGNSRASPTCAPNSSRRRTQVSDERALRGVDLVLASTSRYRRELLARFAPDFSHVVARRRRNAACRRDASRLSRSAWPRRRRTRSPRVARMRWSSAAIRSPISTAVRSASPAAPMRPPATRGMLGRSRRVPHGASAWSIRGRHPLGHHSGHRHHACGLPRAARRRDRALRRPRKRHSTAPAASRPKGSGIALFERIESSDPTALIGLPLIVLARLLRAAGVALP